jgi:hypothetical protein
MKNVVSNSALVAFLCMKKIFLGVSLQRKAFLSHAEMDFEWDYKLNFLLKCDNNGTACTLLNRDLASARALRYCDASLYTRSHIRTT